MYVYVQALDFGKLLKIQVESTELVRSLKAKIDYELGGNVPEDIVDSLNYLGVTLDCSTPLSAYGIRDSSFLYMGRQLQYQYQSYQNPLQNNQVQQMQATLQAQVPVQQTPQYQQPIIGQQIQVPMTTAAAQVVAPRQW